MKAQDTDIQIIRKLRDRYYDGTSNPNDERRLREFFSVVDRSDLPSDLQADAAMLSAISDFDEKMYMSADTRKITDAYLSAAVRTTGRKRRNGLMLLWSPVAAAVIVFIAATVFVLTESENSHPADTIFAERSIIAANDNYIEIDNSEEADILIRETFTLIGKRMDLANKTVSKTSSKIDKTNSTVKNILKNEKI